MWFKDEVRRVGASIGIDPELLGRHPFPGPGLGIRILGDITAEKVRMLQEVDAIFINGLKSWNLYDQNSLVYSKITNHEVNFRGTHVNRFMGGLEIYNDSIHANLSNPKTLRLFRLLF